LKEFDRVTVTTLVDNDTWKRGLSSSWGLSLYVEAIAKGRKHIVLMDTSGSPGSLFQNASELHVDFSNVEAVFISHWHRDHCGCLSSVLQLVGQSIPVYLPSRSFSGFERIAAAGGVPKACPKPLEILEGMMSTGSMGVWTKEHSLLINVRDKGLVVLTGCSHPGIEKIARRAVQISNTRVYAILGGLHISGVREGKNTAITLQEMGVKLISPCHCTGTNAKAGIKKVMKQEYVANGSGKTISISANDPSEPF